MVRLRRAADLSGPERATLLEGAERAFLAIREEAEGPRSTSAYARSTTAWARSRRGTSSSSRCSAAFTVAHIATDLEDEASWLSRCDPALPPGSCCETQGRRALRDGDFAAADKAYAEAAASRDRQATHNAIAANNAVIALLGRRDTDRAEAIAARVWLPSLRCRARG